MSNLPFSSPNINNEQNPDQPPPVYNLPPGQGYPPGAPPSPYANYSSPPPIPGYTPYGYQPYHHRPDRTGDLVGFWPRAVALFIDSLIISIPTAIFNGVLNAMIQPLWNDWGTWTASQYTFGWSSTMIFWGLYAWFCYTNLRGNTLGKSVMGIKLINQDGSKPSLPTFLLHFTVGYWINQAVFCLGYIWSIFEPNKQTLGQKVLKDLTVRGKW